MLQMYVDNRLIKTMKVKYIIRKYWNHVICLLYPCCHPSIRFVKLTFRSYLICYKLLVIHLQPTVATPVSPSKPETSRDYPLYIGVYDHSAKTPEDLSFKKGDLMYIINDDKLCDLWFARRKDTGKEGYILRHYVTKYRGLESEK